MTTDELNKALYGIEEQQRVADRGANTAARLLMGRLQHVDSYYLKALKRELRDFNMVTGAWSEK